jgi:hypothetical protein
MTYFYFGLAAYLVLGVILTFVILPGPMKRRLGFRDVVLGSIFMPILFVLLIFFDISEEMWARILIVLAFDPPEKMRPGAPKPVSRDLDHQ